MQIDNYNSPLIIPLIQLGQTNVNLTQYQFAMGYGITITSAFNVIFRPNNLSPIPKQPLQEQDISSTYYYIYYYEELLILINECLQTCLNALIVLNPGLAGTTPPTFTYNSQTGIVLTADSTKFQQSYGTTADTGKIQIYMNQKVAPLFNGFSMMQLATPNNCKLSLLMDPTMNTITNMDYVITNQSLQELCYWSSVVEYQITTNMPILSEFSGAPIGDNSQTQTQQFSILTDLSVDTTNNVSYHTLQIYNNLDNLRLFNLLSNNPMTTYNASVYILDAYGRRFPLLLNYGQTVQLKFSFIKKSIYGRF